MPEISILLLADVNILGQSIGWPDLIVVGLLILLEGLLSIDNALVLGLLAKRLPKELRTRALSYGLLGAFVFRVLAILLAGFLLQWTIAKLLGGGYLIFIALKHLLVEAEEEVDNKVVLDAEGQPALVDATTGGELDRERENLEIEQRVPIGASIVTDPEYNEGQVQQATSGAASCNVAAHSQAAFWRTVLVIELTDIAFAVDSILAAMALAGSKSSKLWVVIVGGILGVVLMRFAAALFIKLLDRFPRFEISAYLLVIVIGLKLVLDWGCNSDWSFRQSTWLRSQLGGWQQACDQFEAERRELAGNYHHWLETHWPLGVAPAHDHPTLEAAPEESLASPPAVEAEAKLQLPEHVPHLLDFHDLRRPESLTFWALMALCFGLGFLPQRSAKAASPA
jgi:predicted tellurium resistance membrane protein TerC